MCLYHTQLHTHTALFVHVQRISYYIKSPNILTFRHWLSEVRNVLKRWEGVHPSEMQSGMHDTAKPTGTIYFGFLFQCEIMLNR